jgi:hypothetical protein
MLLLLLVRIECLIVVIFTIETGLRGSADSIDRADELSLATLKNKTTGKKNTSSSSTAATSSSDANWSGRQKRARRAAYANGDDDGYDDDAGRDWSVPPPRRAASIGLFCFDVVVLMVRDVIVVAARRGRASTPHQPVDSKGIHYDIQVVVVFLFF